MYAPSHTALASYRPGMLKSALKNKRSPRPLCCVHSNFPAPGYIGVTPPSPPGFPGRPGLRIIVRSCDVTHRRHRLREHNLKLREGGFADDADMFAEKASGTLPSATRSAMVHRAFRRVMTPPALVFTFPVGTMYLVATVAKHASRGVHLEKGEGQEREKKNGAFCYRGRSRVRR